MFLRKCLMRALRNPRANLGIHPNFCESNTVSSKERCRIGDVTCNFTRCYSDSRNGNKDDSVPHEVKSRNRETLDGEEEIEIFDVEEERSKQDKTNPFSKFKVFKDEDATVILDVEEERLFSHLSDAPTIPQRHEFDGISFERGIHGVFEVEELVSFLKEQNAQEIVVIKVPDELSYADHMVIVSGKSKRHLLSLANIVRKLFKRKMQESDKIPKIEGKKDRKDEWLALDLGNIILHLFTQNTRAEYDLESLWTLGPEFDPHLNKEDDKLSAIISKHSLYLGDLQPADSKQ